MRTVHWIPPSGGGSVVCGSSSVITTAVQANGKILIGGAFTNISGTARNNIARLNADGTLDPGFDRNAVGTGSFPFVHSTAVQADGKIVIGGRFTTVGGVARNHIARLNADGTLDTGFSPDANDAVFNTALQADGKIVIGAGLTNVGGAPIYRAAVERSRHPEPHGAQRRPRAMAARRGRH